MKKIYNTPKSTLIEVNSGSIMQYSNYKKDNLDFGTNSTDGVGVGASFGGGTMNGGTADGSEYRSNLWGD